MTSRWTFIAEYIFLMVVLNPLAGQETSDTLKIKAVTQNPHGMISIPCNECHTTGEWTQLKKNMAFDHTAQTDFPLEGQHQAGECKACHANLLFVGAKKKCYECHTDIHKGQLGKECDQCHSPKGWQPSASAFQHDLTRFPLIGVHAVTDCRNCHVNQQEGEFKGVATECVGCHNKDYQETINPNHAENHFPMSCEMCHTPRGWSPSFFIDHAALGFALAQGHQGVDCRSCHIKGYKNTPSDCYACHRPDYETASDPNHTANQFSTACEECHTTNRGWAPATFDHAKTQFVLTGSHITTDCRSCHATGFINTPKDCYACHEKEYTASAKPNHASNFFPHDCLQCHNTVSWIPSTFDHNATQFVLTGAHLPLECQACHAGGYVQTPKECYACHQQDYIKTTNPNHAANGFETTCESCHNTTAWKPSTFDHNQTLFPLTGAHRTVACQSCHTSGYTGTPTDCYACHHADYASTVNPNHTTSHFPTTCVLCHTTTAWTPASYDHNATQFPLTGAHQAVPCQSCHASGYTGTPTDCYACHQADFSAAVNPNHIGLQFPHTCDNGCHNTTAWSPSVFNHGTYTGYPLQGAHQAIAGNCSNCHSGNLTNANSACYSCHASDYNNAVHPSHTGSSFSTDCQTCHGQTVWIPWTVNHNIYFPINSGAHGGIWSGCGGGSGDGAGCHTNDNNFQLFSCVHCHVHNMTDMNNKHSEESGYSYSSEACYSCHPNGTH